MIKVIVNPDKEQIENFEKFSDRNWGEHDHDDSESGLNFFDLHRIIFEYYQNDILVSGLVVFIKSAVFKSKIITFAGIGGVVTHLSHRHRGYSTKVLKYTINYLKKMKIGTALLCTDIERLGGLYSGVGFVPLGKNYLFEDKSGHLKIETQGMICNVSSNDDFNFLLKTKEKIIVGRSNF